MTAIRFGTGMAVDGGVGVVPPGRVADSKAERRPEPLFVSGPWWFRAISGRGARRVRGGRPWSGGGSVAGLGRAAACPGPGPAVGGPWGGGGPRLRTRRRICGARGDGGVCSSFYEGPAVAGDPVARCRSPAARGGRSRPARPTADEVSERRPEKVLFQAPVVSGRARGAPAPGRVRGRRPWASGGGRVTGGLVGGADSGSGGWRLGRWRLGRCPAWSRLRRSSGRRRGPGPRLRAAAVRGVGFGGGICGARGDGGALLASVRERFTKGLPLPTLLAPPSF
jgi:hypothetical protein